MGSVRVVWLRLKMVFDETPLLIPPPVVDVAADVGAFIMTEMGGGELAPPFFYTEVKGPLTITAILMYMLCNLITFPLSQHDSKDLCTFKGLSDFIDKGYRNALLAPLAFSLPETSIS